MNIQANRRLLAFLCLAICVLGCATNARRVEPVRKPGLQIHQLAIAPIHRFDGIELTFEMVNRGRVAVLLPGVNVGQLFAYSERRTWRGWRVPGFVCSSDLMSFELEPGARSRFTQYFTEPGLYRVVADTEWEGRTFSESVRVVAADFDD